MDPADAIEIPAPTKQRSVWSSADAKNDSEQRPERNDRNSSGRPTPKNGNDHVRARVHPASPDLTVAVVAMKRYTYALRRSYDYQSNDDW
jgi:hypothetical protein